MSRVRVRPSAKSWVVNGTIRVTLLLALMVFTFTGCRARATVTIRLDDSGAGEVAVRVTLDRDAVDSVVGLGSSLDDAVLLDGFADAGWRIEPWLVDEESGRAVLVLRKAFVGAEQLEAVLRELAGDLVDVDVAVQRSRGVLASSDSLQITVDAAGLAVRVADDPVLSERLAAAGLDVDASDAALTKQLAKSLRVDVRASLGGRAEAIELRPGDRVTLDLEHDTTHWDRLVIIALALVAVALGVLLLAVAGSRRTRRADGHRTP